MMPVHVGIILDGNRRFAKYMMQNPWIGHKYGVAKSREVVEWACKSGIKYVTAYVLSLENITSRPKRELKYIIDIFDEEIESVLEDTKHVVHKFGVNVKFIGRTNILPEYLQNKMHKVEVATQNYSKHFLNIAVAYGGQQEIVDATKRIVDKCLSGIIKVSEVDEKIFKQNMYTNGQPYPDLILRTGGEKRLSNFLPFQSVYSELIFIDKKWPEITSRDFNNVLKEYSKRKRKFGK